jgi:hypothetical protein
MPALYTALAILGWLAFCALIAWFVGSVLDYAAKVHEDYAREFANANHPEFSDSCTWGDIPHLHGELMTGQRIGCGLGDAAYRAAAGPSRTHSTQVQLPSTRFLPSGEEGSI